MAQADDRFIVDIGPMTVKRLDGSEFFLFGGMRWTGVGYGDVVRIEQMLAGNVNALVEWAQTDAAKLG